MEASSASRGCTTVLNVARATDGRRHLCLNGGAAIGGRAVGGPGVGPDGGDFHPSSQPCQAPRSLFSLTDNHPTQLQSVTATPLEKAQPFRHDLDINPLARVMQHLNGTCAKWPTATRGRA